MRYETAEPTSDRAADFSLSGLLAAVARAIPDRPAVIAGRRRVSFGALDARATALARYLCRAGVTDGARVAIVAFNRAEWLEAAFGAWRAGAVPVNVNYRYVPAEMEQVLRDSGAVAVIAEHGLTSGIARVRANLPALEHVLLLNDGTGAARLRGIDFADALAQGERSGHELPVTSGENRYLLYTGGTTGAPKGVIWRQVDLFRAALERRGPKTARITTPSELGQRARDSAGGRMLVLGPLMHAAGQWNALSMLFSGMTVVLNTDRTFEAHRVLDLIDREAVTTVQCVGDVMARPLAEALLAQPHRCASMRGLTSGGTPLTPPVRELWRSVRPGITIKDSYGGSETGVCGAATAPTSDGADRRFTMGTSVAVLDERLRALPPGSPEVGRIARTGHIPLGYHNDPAMTAATFPTDETGRRWVISGDYGTVAEDGSITLLGRGSSVINTGGEKVYAEEVESTLKSHPAIEDAIVVSAPDERLGQSVAAVVSLERGRRFSERWLREFCRQRLAGFKVPRRIHVVDEVKRTTVGKQDYRWASSVVREPAPLLETAGKG
ncbi:acyl-CoA synthetase [Salinactinospora qingdaonensis]|uniref:Acyl-CoA synthetase n=2 Tax=Salinactinospora qingdaonensis TaxID=702744 RepID=A0ABP7EX08_9ACTN